MIIYSTDIGKDRCTVALYVHVLMESASDCRRRLARERLQRCHLADIKLFFPLAFSQSRSPAYVCTALLVHVYVTIQIFVVVLVVVVFVVSCNWFFPANHKSVVSFCFCLHELREAFLRMRIPSNYSACMVSLQMGHCTSHECFIEITPDFLCPFMNDWNYCTCTVNFRATATGSP